MAPLAARMVARYYPLSFEEKVERMNYIRISNEAGDINRLFLEKLGLSTKRNDENTIGQFGSGSKFAPIAALRNGWQWINVGTDNDGPYQMEYVSKNENGINSIYYKYTVNDEVIYKPSSFTLEAGVLSWDHTFQIFREAFSNALDEFIANNVAYSVDFVDNIEWEPNTFSVYITADPELVDIVNNFDKWFDINRNPLITTNSGIVYTPISDEINIYHKGVYVYGDLVNSYGGDIAPFYDYRLNNVQLNEERRLRDTYFASNQIVNIWTEIFTGSIEDHRNVEFCENIIRNVNSERWEFTHISSYSFNYVTLMPDSPLYLAWANIHGENSVMLTPQEERFITTIETVYGRNGVIVENALLYPLLKEAGISTLQDVAGDDLDFDFVEFSSGNKKEMLDTAMRIVQKYDSDLDKVSQIRVFLPNSNQDYLLGVAKDSSIYLSTQAFVNMETLISTLIHELDHIVTGLNDEDREFRNIADKRIGKLVLELYGENVRLS